MGTGLQMVAQRLFHVKQNLVKDSRVLVRVIYAQIPTLYVGRENFLQNGNGTVPQFRENGFFKLQVVILVERLCDRLARFLFALTVDLCD